MSALNKHPAEVFDYHLQRAAENIDFNVLLAHRDEVLSNPRLLPHVREHLEQRLALAAEPSDVLWERLSTFAGEIEQCYAGEFDARVSDRLIGELARRADPPLVERALTMLRTRGDGGTVGSWHGIFLVMYLGRLRCEGAIDLLVEQLADEDDADVL